MPVTHDDMERSHQRLVEVSEELARDSSERKESDRRSRTTTRWLIVLTIIDTLALLTVMWGLTVIRDYQAQGSERGKRIEATSNDNHKSLVILECAVKVPPNPDPIAARAALSKCIEESP